jgi:hypothetical protein
MFLSAPFLKALGNSTSLNVEHGVLLPYKTTGKIIVLYVLIFMFSDSRLEDKGFWIKQHLPHLICS